MSTVVRYLAYVKILNYRDKGLHTSFLLLLLLFIRYARAGVQAFLKGVASSIGGEAASHDAWLPPLTTDLLLQPHLGLFPFPSYFSKLHEFLAAFYHSGI